MTFRRDVTVAEGCARAVKSLILNSCAHPNFPSTERARVCVEFPLNFPSVHAHTQQAQLFHEIVKNKTRLRKIFPNLANESENFRGYFNVGRWVFWRDFRFGRRSRGKIFFPPAHTDRTKLCVNFNIFLRSAQIAYAWLNHPRWCSNFVEEKISSGFGFFTVRASESRALEIMKFICRMFLGRW